MPNTTENLARAIAKDCFAVRLRKLNRIISGIYDENIRPFGITIAQFNLLVSIGARGQASPTQLVQSLSLEKSTVSRNIEKMKQKGWLIFSSDTDKRSHRLSLTPEGEQLLKDAAPAWQRAQQNASEILGPLASQIETISVI